jgi:hypothetical protein
MEVSSSRRSPNDCADSNLIQKPVPISRAADPSSVFSVAFLFQFLPFSALYTILNKNEDKGRKTAASRFFWEGN